MLSRLPHDGSSLSRRAREFRKEPTPSEALLWEALRRNRLGVHFRRQHAIDAYVVDFVCLTRRLVVEIDGAVHDHPAVALADARRQAVLESLGFRVLRVSAENVKQGLAGVLRRIRAALGG